MSPYTKALRHVTVGMVLSWRNVPVHLFNSWRALREMFWALAAWCSTIMGIGLCLILPLLLPLAPVAAWLVLRDEKLRAAQRRAALKSRFGHDYDAE